MGLLLPEGTHTVTLRYASPGTGVGAVITIGCWVLYLALAVRFLCKKRRKK